MYLVDVGLPAWWFGYLALLGRPVANGSPEHFEWYPVGRLVIWAALLGSLVAVGVIVRFGFDPASIKAGLQRTLEALFQVRTPDGLGGLAGTDEIRELIAWLAVWLPRLGALLCGLLTATLPRGRLKLSGTGLRSEDGASLGLPARRRG